MQQLRHSLIELPERLTPPDTIDVRRRVAAGARASWRGDATQAAWVRPAPLSLLAATALLSFDSSNAITVDKTPARCGDGHLGAALRLQRSALAPQARVGVASVRLLFLTVRRSFGPGAGRWPTIRALTPVATLMFRFNNPDALLTPLLYCGRLRDGKTHPPGSQLLPLEKRYCGAFGSASGSMVHWLETGRP
jgi:hypothetical protein